MAWMRDGTEDPLVILLAGAHVLEQRPSRLEVRFGVFTEETAFLHLF